VQVFPGLVAFLLVTFVVSVVLWALSAATTVVHTVSDDACTAFSASLTAHPNEFLERTLKCPDSSQAEASLDAAMSTANLQVANANNFIKGEE